MKSNSEVPENTDETTRHDQKIPSSRRGAWLIYALLAAVGILSVVLSQIYREMPKRSEVLERRKIKPEWSTYVLPLSPLDSAFAATFSGDVVRSIGKDSGITKMVITGTAVYKQCTSLAEYGRLIAKGVREAHPPAIGTHSMMLAKVMDVMTADTAQARLYIVGSFGAPTLETVRKELQTTLNGLRLRTQKLGRIDVFIYTRPTSDTVGHLFAEYLRAGGFTVEER